MKTIAKQAASSFLNARLSQRLASAREMEAFHGFSTFVLHDLKNFISMLSLIVQNMDRNIGNPEFRKEALANLSQTVEKMKRLMEQLAILSRTPDIRLDEVDPNELIREVLAELGDSLKSRIVLVFQGFLRVRADPPQIKKVLANLILNSEEAVTGEGEIRLETFAQDGMIVLSVSDNGCGIESGFLEKRLFRPFSTTKSHGFGVGLYESKQIIEAHGGRLDVRSRVGEGSSFQIFIPGVDLK